MVISVITISRDGVFVEDHCAICLAHYDPCTAVDLLGARLVCEILFG
jgi:hypothetical protein